MPPMEVRDDLRYTGDHEWVRIEAGRAVVGITDFAQASLGDIVYVQLPEVGARVERGGTLGEVESTKSVSEVYAPVGGVVAEVNTAVIEAPERLNSDPYGAGWLCVIEGADAAEVDQLLPAQRYRELIEP